MTTLQLTIDFARVFDGLTEICAADAEFARRARFMSGNVRFGVDETGYVLQFAGGRLIGVTAENPSLVWDYEVAGPAEDWERMVRGEIDLTRALVPQFGSTRIRGNSIKYGGDAEAIVHISRLLPRAAEQLGIEVLPAPAPAPAGREHPWRTDHEVLGRYVEVDGIRTYYETVGDVASAPLVFLGQHTAGRDCRQWQQLADVLAPYGAVVAPDLPGHCKSWPIPELNCLKTMEDIAQFTWAFRAALGITQPTVVMGCSVGGNLVFQLAGDHPEEVAALVSLQGAAYTPTQPESTLMLMDHPMVNPAYHHVDRTISLTGARTPQPVRDYIEWETRIYSSPSIWADLTAYTNFDYRDRLSRITCPALLIRGRADWIVSDEMVDDTAERLVNAAAVEVVKPEGVGHFAHVEQPQEVGQSMIDFLTRTGVIPNQTEVNR